MHSSIAQLDLPQQVLLQSRGNESVGVPEAGGEGGDQDTERFVVKLVGVDELAGLVDYGVEFLGFGSACFR